jgi:hypothetical protein
MLLVGLQASTESKVPVHHLAISHVAATALAERILHWVLRLACAEQVPSQKVATVERLLRRLQEYPLWHYPAAGGLLPLESAHQKPPNTQACVSRPRDPTYCSP